MKRFVLKISFTIVALFIAIATFAQSATFVTNAPMRVSVGENFRIEFALSGENVSPDKDSFTAPPLTGFDILAGPAISQGSSIQIVNGDMSKSSSYTYTYVVSAKSAGTNTIGAASIEVKGTKYTTKPLPIDVTNENSTSQQGSQGQQDSQGDRIAEDDVLLRTIVSRTSLFKGEPLRATIKLYSRVAIAGAENEKMPSFNGFWSQDIKGNNREIQRETYNGKVYETHTLYDYLLYPQQSGKLPIDPASMTIVAQVRVPSRNMDPFFGGGYDIVNVRRHIATPKITIDVKELPSGAPASFNGAVGDFTMSCSLSPERITANSSLSYTVKISGTGNLTLLQAPNVDLPSSFEQYNVKTTESITKNQYGASGYKQFEYPIIPRSEGAFSLQPTKFSFFNTKTMAYETLTSPTYELEILPDNSSSGATSAATVQRSLSREDVKLLSEDIRFIKIENGEFRRENEPFMLSKSYYLSFAGIVALFMAAFVMLRRHIKESQNSTLVRGKKANKVAVQRFKTAKAHMETHDKQSFYTEMLSAIWGYMSDKFNIPVANLTKESVRKELSRRGVSQDQITTFSDIITQCDEAQYSPMASSQMNEVYMNAVKLISKIEAEIKR